MSECGSCRAFVAELAEAADALPLLAPEAEPPPGFERRVIAAISAGRRRSWRRLAMVAASVAAATAIVSIVGVRLVEGTDSRPVVAPAESTSVENLAMTTDDGIDVGEVHISDGQPSVVVVTVDYLISDGNYAIEVSSPKRADVEIGRIAVEDGSGSWGGTTRLPPEGKISLVGGDGDARCSATLPTA